MKIKCISSFYIVGKGVFDTNQVVDLDDELAKKLIDDGVAIVVDEVSVPTEKEEDVKAEEHHDDLIIKEKDKEEVKEKQKEKAPRYYTLKVSELKQILSEKGIEIPDGARKKDLLALLDEVK